MKINNLRKSDEKYEKFVQIYKKPLSPVKSAVKRHLESTNFENRIRNERPHKLTSYGKGFYLRQIEKDPTLRAPKLKLTIIEEMCT